MLRPAGHVWEPSGRFAAQRIVCSRDENKGEVRSLVIWLCLVVHDFGSFRQYAQISLCQIGDLLDIRL